MCRLLLTTSVPRYLPYLRYGSLGIIVLFVKNHPECFRSGKATPASVREAKLTGFHML